MDEFLLMIFDWVMKHSWSQYVVAGMLVLKFVTQFMPSTWQGRSWYNYMMKLVNMFTMNNGYNKNADDKPLVVANAR